MSETNANHAPAKLAPPGGWKSIVIITSIVEGGHTPYDATIIKGSLNLAEKYRDAAVLQANMVGDHFDPSSTQALLRFLRRPPIKSMKIYIRGHGDFTNQKVGRLDADGWASLLQMVQLPSTVGLISVTGC